MQRVDCLLLGLAQDIRPSRRFRQKGFTLIELLVVVAIMTILIALLMPSLASAREQSKATICLGHLRAIGIANSTYQAEFGGFNVPAAYATAGGGSSELWATIFIYTGTLPRLSGDVTAANASYTSKPPYNRSVLYCPSGLSDMLFDSVSVVAANPDDPNFRRACGQHSTDGILPALDKTIWAHTWYGINCYSGSSAPGGGHVYPSSRLPLDIKDADGNHHNDYWLAKVSNIDHPASLVMFFDGYWGTVASEANRINGRHIRSTKTNVVFVDGHAESLLRSTMPIHNAAINDSGLLDTTGHPWVLTKKYPYPYWRMDQ